MKVEEIKEKKIVTLEELQNNLPVPQDDKSSQDFTFRNWTMAEEKQIAKLKTSRGVMGKFVSGVFELMIDKFCGMNFQDLKNEEKIVILNQLEMPNIMYMWVWLRCDVMGEHIVMDINCPVCNRLNKEKTFTLSKMDVSITDKKDPKTVVYKLLKPFDFNGEKVEQLKLRVTKWEAMENSSDDVATNEGLMKEIVFRNSIIGFNDSEGYIDIDSMLTKLHKRDIEALSNAISKHNGGPTLMLRDKCEYCNRDYFKYLNWGYDYFFGQSSLPEK